MKQGFYAQGKCFIQRCLYLNISCSSAAILMFYLTPNHLIKEVKMLPIFSFHSSLIVLSLHSAPPPSAHPPCTLATSSPLHPCLPSLPPALAHTRTHTGHGSNYLQTLFWHTTFLLPFLIAYKCYPNQIRLIKNICKATGMLGQWFMPRIKYVWIACTARTHARTHAHKVRDEHVCKHWLIEHPPCVTGLYRPGELQRTDWVWVYILEIINMDF